VLALRGSTVVVARPSALHQGLEKGTIVRFPVPNDPSRHLRMEVVTPNFNLVSGSPVFLCKVPTAFSEGSRRRSERFSTSRFNNLALEVPELKSRFRVLDLSLTGAKVLRGTGGPRVDIPLGRPLHAGSLQLGTRVRVDLEQVIPRTSHGPSVGMEFAVKREGDSSRFLTHLLNSLEKTDVDRLSAETL
jgi:hypothetical protein